MCNITRAKFRSKNYKDINILFNMSFKFIVFEGVDGAGKTSLAKALVKRINGHYYYNPPEIIGQLRSYADQSDPEIRFQYYLLGNHIASKEIHNLLQKKHVVCDCYIFSTIAYHEVLLKKKLSLPKLLMPDKIIFVTADWNVIDTRIKMRESSSKYEEISFLMKVNKKYDSLFSRMKNVINICTTNQNAEESIEILLKELKI